MFINTRCSAKMKAFTITLLALNLITGCRRADPVTTLKRDAAECARAWNRADYQNFLVCLSDPVTADTNAREAALEEINSSFRYLESLGLKSLMVSVGDPCPIKKVGSLNTAIVPVTAVISGPGVKITAPSNVLAVSWNGGESWKFVILYQNSNSHINKLFPEFQGKFEMPVSSQPVIEINLNQMPKTTNGTGP